MILIPALVAAVLVVFLIAGVIYERTPLGRHADRLLAGPAPTLADEFDAIEFDWPDREQARR